jgi:hypothetical protein
LGKIEIRIRKDNKIAYSHEKRKWTEKTFDEIGLLNKKTQGPNYLAIILNGLSVGKKFPPSKKPEGKHSVAISRLRDSLVALTGIQDDPFTEINDSDGWKPRFKLTDDRRNADDRAKKAAIYTEITDEINYIKEYDKAGKWIEDNQ